MHDDLISGLDNAVAEVFDLMLTLTCVPASDGDSPRRPCLTATVDFSGTLTGSCSLKVEAIAAVTLTCSLVGLPAEEVASALFPDTVGEVCNMIAGRWKSQQHPPRSLCALSPPVVSPANEDLWEGFLTRFYRFETHHLMVALKVA